jgi:HEXXH motif-containing protein
MEQMLSAPEADFWRVVLAPNTTNRLLWAREDALVPLGRYLETALWAEAAARGERESPERDMWTALGDVHIRAGGGIERSPSRELLLDFDSPTVRNADPQGRVHEEEAWWPLGPGDREAFLEDLRMALEAIDASSPTVAAFIRRFIRVLVVQRNDAGAYSAYSANKYIGRVILSNPQRAGAVAIAESLVHEATHALLYMQIQQDPWGMDGDPLQEEKAVSPWSGRMLPSSTYLHACFVWFGLLNFWTGVLEVDRLPESRVKGRLSRATLGFLNGPLLGHLPEADAPRVTTDVRTAIGEIQAMVLDCFAQARAGEP